MKFSFKQQNSVTNIEMYKLYNAVWLQHVSPLDKESEFPLDFYIIWKYIYVQGRLTTTYFHSMETSAAALQWNVWTTAEFGKHLYSGVSHKARLRATSSSYGAFLHIRKRVSILPYQKLHSTDFLPPIMNSAPLCTAHPDVLVRQVLKNCNSSELFSKLSHPFLRPLPTQWMIS